MPPETTALTALPPSSCRSRAVRPASPRPEALPRAARSPPRRSPDPACDRRRRSNHHGRTPLGPSIAGAAPPSAAIRDRRRRPVPEHHPRSPSTVAGAGHHQGCCQSPSSALPLFRPLFPALSLCIRSALALEPSAASSRGPAAPKPSQEKSLPPAVPSEICVTRREAMFFFAYGLCRYAKMGDVYGSPVGGCFWIGKVR